MSWYSGETGRVIIRLYIQPGAKQHEVVGLVGEELKIKLATPPIEGRANTALIKYLAQHFRVPQSAVQIKSGHKSRHKRVEIKNSMVDPESLLKSE